MDLLLQEKKISPQVKELYKVAKTPPNTALGIEHLNKLINDIQTDIEIVTFEHSLKEDWMEFMDTTATLMNRKSFL